MTLNLAKEKKDKETGREVIMTAQESLIIEGKKQERKTAKLSTKGRQFRFA
jgi:hypothetical protein